MAEAFNARGLDMPKPRLISYAMDLRVKLPARGRFITVVANSVLQLGGNRPTLKKLPIDLPARPWQVAILTLKARTLSPVVERFIECAHEIARSIAPRQRP